MSVESPKWSAKRWTTPVKRLLIRGGRQPRRIKCGAFRSICMNLDPSCQTQVIFGLAEHEVTRFLVRMTSGIKTAADIGVGEGEYTMYFLMKTPANGVYAVEPSEAAWRERPCI
jgi:hypothetical protein